MIALLDWVKRLRPRGRQLLGLSLGPSSSWLFGISRSHSVGVPNLLGVWRHKSQRVGDSGPLRTPTPTGRGPLSTDQRGATLVTYVLVLPLLILLILGSFAVWRIIVIRQTLFLGTYKAAWELSQQARELPFDENEWWGFADPIIRTEVEGNHLIEPGFTLDVSVTLPKTLACPPVYDSRPIDDILFTVEATLSLPTPIRIPYLDPINLTLTEQRTSYVRCPRVWGGGTPPPEEHIY